MIICISPAKTLDESMESRTLSYSQPEYLPYSEKLIRKLTRLSLKRIRSLMGLSDNLAKLNQKRYEGFSMPFTPENAKQAILMFRGDVYEGLKVDDFTEDDFSFAQKHLRILSGLYGILKPLDLIQAYRLEMGTSLSVGRKRNLYQFWENLISDYLRTALSDQGHHILVNLASIEYFKSVNIDKIGARVITPLFKEEREGDLMMISFFAKKARGLLSRYIIKHQLTDPAEIISFDLEGYKYNPNLSTENQPVFTRKS